MLNLFFLKMDNDTFSAIRYIKSNWIYQTFVTILWVEYFRLCSFGDSGKRSLAREMRYCQLLPLSCVELHGSHKLALATYVQCVIKCVYFSQPSRNQRVSKYTRYGFIDVVPICYLSWKEVFVYIIFIELNLTAVFLKKGTNQCAEF